jgi:bile acid:Na+ symporter, BASS family
MESAITVLGYSVACLLMLMTGLAADPDEIRRGFMPGHRALTLRVILVNLFLIPLLALMCVRWIPPGGGIWVGVVLLALCPAAPMAPPLVTAADGDTSWAVALLVPLVLLGTLLLLVYLPLAGSLWRTHSAASEELSSLRLIVLLLPFLLPLTIGLMLRILLLRKAAALLRFVRPVTQILVALFMLIFFVLRHNELREVTVFQLLAYAGFFIICGLLCGLFVGVVSRNLFITAIIMTMYRNFMAALVLCIPLGLSTRVQSDLLALSFVGLAVVFLFVATTSRIRTK